MINPMTRPFSRRELTELPCRALQLFEPPNGAVYSLEATAHLLDLRPRTILIYCKHHLLSPIINAETEGYSFDCDGIRSLRRIEGLRVVCGDNFSSIKVILDLMTEVERLRWELRPSRQGEPGRGGSTETLRRQMDRGEGRRSPT
jgi:DNA-binding transcriptional MerR regulator